MARTSQSQVSTLDEEVVDTAATAAIDAPALVTKVPAPDGELSGKKVTLTIHPTDGDGGSDAVDVQLNGYLYRIPRGVSCEVPEEVFQIVQNARMTNYSHGQGGAVTERTVQRFAFSSMS